ncbi:MAG: efflux RND transporter periplasmic adaptor subunit [Janthinobacterium lividum]
MSIKRPHLIIAVATLAVAAAATYGIVAGVGSAAAPGSEAHAAPTPPAAAVDVATVVTGTITDWQRYSGRLQAVDTVQIRPLVSGTITAVYFKDGALVQKGEALFTIDPRPYQAEVDRTAAMLAVADAHNAYAQTELARAQRLIADHAIAQRDLEQAQNGAREAGANLRGAQAALETARLNLGYTRIVAPVAGRVSRAEITVGNVVSAGAASPPLTSLVSVSPIYAAFDVDEQTYLRYLAHDTKSAVPVSLGLADEDGYSRHGTIASVDNRLDTNSGTIRVRARFDNADGVLLPGLYARIQVGGGAPHPAVMIDDRAVGTDQAKKFVLVVTADKQAMYREVTLGDLHDGLRVVSKGLAPGDRIVVNGLQRVRPGDRVSPNMVPMSADTGAGVQSG